MDDPAALLSFYRRLLRVRRDNPALLAGDYRALPAGDSVLAFLRYDAASGQTCLVALNFAEQAQAFAFDGDEARLRVLFASQPGGDRALAGSALTLTPFEVIIAELTQGM